MELTALFPPEAIGLLVMMYPILCKVQYETLHRAFRSRELWIQVAFSIVLNWIIAPFLMVSGSTIGSSLGDSTDAPFSLLLLGLSSLTKRAFAKDLYW